MQDLEDRLARLERDNEDAISNIDTSNFGTALSSKFNNMQSNINAIAGVIRVSGNTVTINADNFSIKSESGDDLLMGEMPSIGAYQWRFRGQVHANII